MDLVFHRIGQREYATIVTRCDGVRFLVGGVGLKFAIPHDLAHLAIESALCLDRGFWGTIAAGGVFGSMTYLSGRRKPHATARSYDILKANRGHVVEAEGLVAMFNSAFETGEGPTSLGLLKQLRDFAWTPPRSEPRVFDNSVICAAWRSWRQMQELWVQLPIGDQLQFVWSAEQRKGDRPRRWHGEPRPFAMFVAV